MTLPTASASLEALRRLPVPAGPRVDPRDAAVCPKGTRSTGTGQIAHVEMLAVRIARLLERSPIEDQEEADNGG